MMQPGKVISRTAIFLLLGAIVNVSVAWMCAVWTTTGEPAYWLGGPLPDRIKALSPQAWFLPEPHISWSHGESQKPGATLTAVRVTKYGEWGGPTFLVELREHGWPMCSLMCLSSSMKDEPTFYSRGISLPRFLVAVKIPLVPPINDRPLPIRPIVLGFAVNTISYATLLWVMSCAAGKIRRLVRIRRGRCPACAYPVGVSPVCTECGNPLPSPIVQSQ